MTQPTAETPDVARPSWPRTRRREGDCALLNVGALVDERYEIVKLVGHGGMGRVVEVVRLDDHQRLALKYCEGNVLGKRRLVREARILGSIKHPHVLSVVDVNLVHNPPYYVMPLAAETLEAELHVHCGDLVWSIRVFREICLGVQSLHEAGVIHRDLKPANVLRLVDNRHVVADLGTAKREPRNSTILTRTCAILGTLSYLAPEQLMPGGSRQADARTDVFQLGKMLYQMITGRSPVVIESAAMPVGLAHIILRATATRPADRYDDVAKLLDAVESYQNSTAKAACRDPRDVLEELVGCIDSLSSRGRMCGEQRNAMLDALADLDRLTDDELIDALDRVPIHVLVGLARESPTLLLPTLASYARSLERTVARRHFDYADLVARRMQAIFQGTRHPDIRALALQALLIAAVALNRYAAMAVFKKLLYQIDGAELALRIAEMLRDHPDYFQEVAPSLHADRLHPILRCVINDLVWIETISF